MKTLGFYSMKEGQKGSAKWEIKNAVSTICFLSKLVSEFLTYYVNWVFCQIPYWKYFLHSRELMFVFPWGKYQHW